MWNAFAAWVQSAAGQRILDSAVIPALAIIVAGVVAALIARGAVRSIVARADRDALTGSVAGLVEAGRGLAGTTNGHPDRERIDRLRTEADVRLRLARPTGAALAADWAAFRLDAIAGEGVSPVRQAGAEVDELRDRLLAWASRPRRAKRLFASDLERLRAEQAARRPADAAPTPAAPSTPASSPSGPRPDPAPEAAVEAAHPAESARPTGSAQPEPLSARAHDRSSGRPEVPATAVAARSDATAPEGDGGRRPVPDADLVRRTRLTSLDAPPAPPRAEHARHADPAVHPEPEPAARTEAAPAAPAPATHPQAAPAWLDTYDDEADVTRDIDLSKTPPPMSASAVRDRTKSGDDIVPRH